jgi:hypothetical protein
VGDAVSALPWRIPGKSEMRGQRPILPALNDAPTRPLVNLTHKKGLSQFCAIFLNSSRFSLKHMQKRNKTKGHQGRTGIEYVYVSVACNCFFLFDMYMY